MEEHHRALISTWLFACVGLLFVTFIVWGFSGLSEIGLSATEWKPHIRLLPPITASGWNQEYHRYLQSPAYAEQQSSFSLADFKYLYSWEWAHRQATRLFTLAFILPWAYLSYINCIPIKLQPTMVGILGLTLLQGYVGWLFIPGVEDLSGPQHSAMEQYRYAVDVVAAVALYAVLLWTTMTVRRPMGTAVIMTPRLRPLLIFAIAWVAVTMVTGALAAGIDADLVYNDWPQLSGQLPPFHEFYLLVPSVRNQLDDDAATLGHHRLLAIAAVVLVMIVSYTTQGVPLPSSSVCALHALHWSLAFQVALGVLAVFIAPVVPLVALHQASALLLFSALLWLLFTMRDTSDPLVERHVEW